MTEAHKNRYDEVKKIVTNDLINTFWSHIDEHKLFLVKGREELDNIKNCEIEKVETLSRLADYKQAILQLTSQLPKECLEQLNVEFERYETDFDRLVKNQPKKVSEPQSGERFKRQPHDGLILKISKIFKKTGYHISKWPEKTSNAFRKIRGKETKELKPWYQQIHLRDLMNYYLKHKLQERLEPALEIYYRTITITSLSLWNEDENLDKKVAKVYDGLGSTNDSSSTPNDIEDDKVLAEAKSKIEDYIIKTYEQVWDEFMSAYEKAGTIEFSNSKVSEYKTNRLRDRSARKYQLTNKSWHNTIEALKDDWEIDLEIYHLIYSSLDEFYSLEKNVKKKVEENIFNKLNDIDEFINECKSKIERVKNDQKLEALLYDEIDLINSELSVLVERNSENILDQDLPQAIDKISEYITKQVSAISTKRAVLKGSNYTTPKKSSQLSYISPYELINFEYAPRLLKVIEEVKRNTTTYINEAQNILLQLVEIAAFNLESAISAISENDEQEGKTIALTGLERTIDQVTNLRNELLKITSDLNEKMLQGLNDFDSSVIKFTDNENILDLRVRIAKGKAKERSREIRNKIVEGVKNLAPILLRKGKMYYANVQARVRSNLKRIGIGVEKTTITTELADFLAQTEEAIDNLPFVYQRLFRAVPLQDDTFFEGRRIEMGKLSKAFDLWQQGRFAATIVVGEKGAGISTLFNLYLSSIEAKMSKVRIAPDANINSLDNLRDIFNNALGWKVEDITELANKLKSGPKRIIALENVQRVYLKQVGGFENIKTITELVSVTSEKVFWIVGCTTYGYIYLDKTLNLSENFGYTIHLEDLSPENVIEVIERRHKVSGYNLEFEPGTEDAMSKKYNNLDEVSKSQYLKQRFYNELNKIAKSNISIALIYWLRSTKQTSPNTVTISSLKDLDFTFMKGLSLEKLYVLHMLLLHDGLSESEVSKVNKLTLSQCRRILYPLFEDGIIIKTDKLYLINPLLYRQTINLLKTKNILH